MKSTKRATARKESKEATQESEAFLKSRTDQRHSENYGPTIYEKDIPQPHLRNRTIAKAKEWSRRSSREEAKRCFGTRHKAAMLTRIWVRDTKAISR